MISLSSISRWLLFIGASVVLGIAATFVASNTAELKLSAVGIVFGSMAVFGGLQSILLTLFSQWLDIGSEIEGLREYVNQRLRRIAIVRARRVRTRVVFGIGVAFVLVIVSAICRSSTNTIPAKLDWHGFKTATITQSGDTWLCILGWAASITIVYCVLISVLEYSSVKLLNKEINDIARDNKKRKEQFSSIDLDSSGV